jgi:hypothetical protein
MGRSERQSDRGPPSFASRTSPRHFSLRGSEKVVVEAVRGEVVSGRYAPVTGKKGKRLKCEVLLLRGEIQVAQGELVLAAQIVTRAIRIANLNGLVLRRIGGLHLLAEIHRLRGDRDGATRIAARAERASRDTGYHLKPFSLLARIQRP